MPVAEVAELVDALGSGSSGGSPVKVRVFSSAPATLMMKGCNRMMIAALFRFPYPAASLDTLIHPAAKARFFLEHTINGASSFVTAIVAGCHSP